MGKISNSTAMQAQGSDRKTLQAYIKSMEGEIAKALPSVITPERFTRMVLSAVSANPKLAQCSPNSFLAAMMAAAQLGVEPNTPLGQAYLIPYGGDVQFQLGYKGLIDLAYRSGEIEVIQAHVVYENDEFEFEFGLDPKLRHVPARKDRGEAVCVYAMFKTKAGGYGFEVMSMEDCMAHAKKYSKAYGSSSSPWKTSFEEMCKKTVLKRCLKYAPMKSDFVKADETVKRTIDEDMLAVPTEDPVAEVDAEAETVDFDAPQADQETGEVMGPLDAVEEY